MRANVKNMVKKIPLIGNYYQRKDLLEKRQKHSIRLQQELYVQQLHRDPKYADPRHLIHAEHQVFSQNGEDGVVQEIFRRIGTTDKTFVEIGTGSGLQCNTAYWLTQGFHGWWVEGNPKAPRKIQRNFAQPLADKRLQIINRLVTAENIAGLLQQHQVPATFDLFSLDVDRNTYWIWVALSQIRPRVVIMEYNASYPASVDWKVEYHAEKWWSGTHYYGASLKAYELLGREMGYTLVGCESCGVNCFFVRQDLVGDHFAGPFTAEQHYEPARYFLSRTQGHPAGFAD